jgi:esterase/lipase superfamily enzyme
MADLPPWMLLAGILLLALLIYALAWRIVQGTHFVVRAVTRILLGALIVVPVIMFLLYGQPGLLRNEMSAPAPVSETLPGDKAAKAKKKAEAPARPSAAANGEAATEVADTRERMEAAEAQRRKFEEERRKVEEQARQAAKKAAREEVKSAAREGAAAGGERPPEPSAEVAAVPEPEGSVAYEATEGAPAAGAQAPDAGSAPKRVERRYYRRSAGAGPSEEAEDRSFGGAGPETAAPSPAPGAAPEPATPEPGDVAALEAPEEAAPEAEPPSYLESLRPPPPAAANGGSGGASDTAGAAPPAAPVLAEEDEKEWSIVPVFYGTDRKRADKEDRIAYDWHRGRRLELGRALVTIPKEHEVPMVERPWALKIPYVDVVIYEAPEDPRKHFTMKELKALPREEFLALVRERLAKSERFKDHALVFVHGYKNTFDNAIFRTAQIAYDLKFDGAPFLYSWPSGGTLQGYTYDRESASQAEPYLREFLTMVRDETGAKKFSIIAHSMGNQLLLRVLQDLKRSLPEGVLISQLILAAPDVDRDSFEYIVGSIEGIADGVTLYAAANDAALMFSRQVNGGEPRAGDVPEEGPIVVKGVDTIDATATSMDSVGINHSGYAENNALLEDIGKLILEGVRPPGIRQPKLKRVDTDKGAYWQYPAPQP